MKIGIISDTHDQIEATQEALSLLTERGVEKIFHLGDWCSPFMLELVADLGCPVVSVFGNNDADIFKHQAVKPDNLLFADRLYETDLEGKKAVLVHGDPPSVVEGLITSGSYDIVIHGHSHVARIEEIEGTLVINPGSMIAPFGKQKHWTSPSVAVYDTELGKAERLLVNPASD